MTEIKENYKWRDILSSAFGRFLILMSIFSKLIYRINAFPNNITEFFFKKRYQ
jgi:hypothetical protein